MMKMPQKNIKKNHNKGYKKILLVEHEENTRERILNFLNSFNQVEIATNGITGLEKFKNDFYDLIIIDKNLPYKDAEVLSDSINNSFSNVPILFISNHPEDNSENLILINNFEKEYENYMIQYAPHRESEIKQQKSLFSIGNYKLDTVNRNLWYNNEAPIKLSPKLNKLLRILIENKGQLVSKEYLIKKVWYNEEATNLKSMGVYITKLRKLLEKDQHIKINNVYKTGFILTD